MLLETLREELIEDISKALENAYPITSNKITQIIVDSFDGYECENKIGEYAKSNAKKPGVYAGNLFENPENWKKIR